MGFLGGLIVGLIIGCLIGVFMVSLISANGHTGYEDNEQAKYCRDINKKVEDRNEF